MVWVSAAVALSALAGAAMLALPRGRPAWWVLPRTGLYVLALIAMSEAVMQARGHDGDPVLEGFAWIFLFALLVGTVVLIEAGLRTRRSRPTEL